MKAIAVLFFGAGVLLAVRVMFFGVRRFVGADAFAARAWPLSLAAALGAMGTALYFVAWQGGRLPTVSAIAIVLASGLSAGALARWTVRRSAAAAASSPDPDEDPRYRFQGHVARVVSALPAPQSDGDGRIAFVIDGQTLELKARWLPSTTVSSGDGLVESEVVIEHVDGDLALVEPWSLVESRL